MCRTLKFLAGAALLWAPSCYALDSYRFMHVTIDTPWTIFIFLLLTIFAPFVLMAVLAWRYVERKKESAKNAAAQAEDQP